MVNLPPLNAIVDEEVAARFGWTVPALAREYLAGGATFLQVRAKRADSGAYLRMCEEVVALARGSGASVIVTRGPPFVIVRDATRHPSTGSV